MPAKRHSLRFRVFNLARVASHAAQFYMLWRQLSGASSMGLETWGAYSDFWATARTAAFQAMINNCAMIEDNRGHRLSIALEEMISAGNYSALPLVEMKRRLKTEAIPLARKVEFIRNNTTAHRSISLSYREAMERARLTPEEIGKLVAIYTEITDVLLVRGFGGNSWLSMIGPKEAATRKLFDDLARLRANPTQPNTMNAAQDRR